MYILDIIFNFFYKTQPPNIKNNYKSNYDIKICNNIAKKQNFICMTILLCVIQNIKAQKSY